MKKILGMTILPMIVAAAAVLTIVSCESIYNNILIDIKTGFISIFDVIKPSGQNIAPVLDPLSLTASDANSITMAQPTFSTSGSPQPTVEAYIGLDGTISVAGNVVSNALDGPVDVSSGGYQFTNLGAATTYRIIVVAQNNAGYSVQQIVQSTGTIAPVLNSLSVAGFDGASITLAQPTFYTAGNPLPTVEAYIGINGTISVTGSVVSNALQGPVDVSSGGFRFPNLNPSTAYRIIVVAQNSAGYSVQQIVQSTGTIAPVLNSLTIAGFDAFTITLTRPTFSTAGNPQPTVMAYIGVNGTISVTGSVVSNAIHGPVDVSSGNYQFIELIPLTVYRIIVVAQNSVGYSVQQIIQSTGGIAPVLNGLVILGYSTTTITLSRPTFSVPGNPTPTVVAYVGNDKDISITGTVVSGSDQGPIDVSSMDYYIFQDLIPYINYRIIVVAENTAGYSVQQILQTTQSSSSSSTTSSSNTSSSSTTSSTTSSSSTSSNSSSSG